MGLNLQKESRPQCGRAWEGGRGAVISQGGGVGKAWPWAWVWAGRSSRVWLASWVVWKQVRSPRKCGSAWSEESVRECAAAAPSGPRGGTPGRPHGGGQSPGQKVLRVREEGTEKWPFGESRSLGTCDSGGRDSWREGTGARTGAGAAGKVRRQPGAGGRACWGGGQRDSEAAAEGRGRRGSPSPEAGAVGVSALRTARRRADPPVRQGSAFWSAGRGERGGTPLPVSP